MGIFKVGRPKEYVIGQDSLPKGAGVYRLRDGIANEHLYIGKTKNFAQRMVTHHKIKTGDRVSFQKADGRYSENSILRAEIKAIEKHTPLLNQRAGGGGRLAKK